MYVLRYRDSSHSIPVSSQKVVSGRITTRLKESTAKYKVVQNCHPEKVTNKAKFKKHFFVMFPTIRPEQLKPKLKSQLLKVEKINRRLYN